jgi:hypothetical protein
MHVVGTLAEGTLMDAQTPDMQAVVERLEKQNRRLTVWGGAAFVLVVIGLTILLISLVQFRGEYSVGVASYYQAPVFVVTGEEGFALTVLDKDGLSVRPISAWDEGSRVWVNPDGLWIRDTRGLPRAMLSGSRGLALHDEDGHGRAALFLNEDGSPTLALYDKTGNIIWQAPPPNDAPEEAPPPD